MKFPKFQVDPRNVLNALEILSSVCFTVTWCNMGQYTTFYIADKGILSFKYSLGEDFWRVLNLIFKETDFSIKKIKEDDEEIIKFIGYKTTVKEALLRLDFYHLSLGEIDKTLSNLLNVKTGHLFSEEYKQHSEDYYDGAYDDDLWNKYNVLSEEALKKADYLGLGLYLEIRFLRRMLDGAKPSDTVILDFSEMTDLVSIDSIKNFWEPKFKSLGLQRDYLTTAKVFFTTSDFDLVYIYLTMALEVELYRYSIRKYKENNKKYNFLQSIMESERVHLIEKLKLVNAIQKSGKIESGLLSSASETVQRRHSIIHYGIIRNFRREQIKKDIESIEEIIKIIQKL